MSRRKKKYWIPENIKKGALHKQLGYHKDEKIPISLLAKIKRAKIGDRIKVRGRNLKVTHLLKRRAVMAYNLKKIKRR